MEEETYSIIFTSLKHPIRRKILRMLYEHSRSFSEMQETFRIESSHLTYHLENLRELIYKTDDGKYRLSTFGEAAVITMSKVEEAPRNPSLSIKWKSVFAVLMIGLVILTAVSYAQYQSFNRISAENDALTSDNQQLAEQLDALTKYLQSLAGAKYIVMSRTIYIRADGSVDPPTAPISTDDYVTYTFTDNIVGAFVVERSHIIIDGAGYTLQGPGYAWEFSGFTVAGSYNVTIHHVNIEGFSQSFISKAILLRNTSHNTIFANTLTDNYYGISLSSSSNNSIFGNTITKCERGISLYNSSNNTLRNNDVSNNYYGISLSSSSNNTLRNHDASNNMSSFYIYGSSLSHYIQDIDDSNAVDGKPVYYWVNRQDMTVPLDAGYVALVNCTNMTVQNLRLTNNGQGVVLAYTTNSTITKNNITNNERGISLYNSSNNSISGNNITANNRLGIQLSISSNNSISGNNITANNRLGIWVSKSSNNSIFGNNITNGERGISLSSSSNNTLRNNDVSNNYYGISLSSSSNNTISGNNITNNGYGINLWKHSSDNNIYHNNLIDNTKQIDVNDSHGNAWDDDYPSGGNYWSDYEERYPNSTEIDGSGIWDTPYVIDENNQDNYPLRAHNPYTNDHLSIHPA